VMIRDGDSEVRRLAAVGASDTRLFFFSGGGGGIGRWKKILQEDTGKDRLIMDNVYQRIIVLVHYSDSMGNLQQW